MRTLIKPTDRRYDSALEVFTSTLEQEPWRWDNGTLSKSIRTEITKIIARHPMSLSNRIKLLHKRGPGNPVLYYRTKLSWIDFQALVKGMLILTREEFTMEHFQKVVTSWVIQEVTSSDGTHFKEWELQGGIYGPGSVLGSWFASKPRKDQILFLKKLLMSEMRLRSSNNAEQAGDFFDLISRLRLAHQLIRSIRARDKTLDHIDSLHRELLDLAENPPTKKFVAEPLMELVRPLFAAIEHGLKIKK